MKRKSKRGNLQMSKGKQMSVNKVANKIPILSFTYVK